MTGSASGRYEVHDANGFVATFFTKRSAVDRAQEHARNEPSLRPVVVCRTALVRVETFE